MNKLTLSVWAITAALAVTPTLSYAEQTTSEKVEAKAKEIGREGKKAVHRTKEAVCMEGDVECAAKKAKNRGIEAKDKIKDKAHEVKDHVD